MKGRTLSDQNKGSRKTPSTKMFGGGAIKGALSKLSQKTGKDLSGAFAKKASSNIFDKAINKAIAAGKLDPAKIRDSQMNLVQKFLGQKIDPAKLQADSESFVEKFSGRKK